MEDNKKDFDIDSLPGAALWLFGGLFIVILLGMSTLNAYAASLLLRPGDYARAYVFPLLFDGGLVIYVAEFALMARGGRQRLFALAGIIVSFVGAIAMNVLYLDASSRGAGYTGEETAAMAQWLLRAFEVALAFHIGNHIFMFLTSPYIIAAMEDQAREWRIESRARKLASAMVSRDTEEEAARRMAEADRDRLLERLEKRTGVRLADMGTSARRAMVDIPVEAAYAPPGLGAPVFAAEAPPMPQPARHPPTEPTVTYDESDDAALWEDTPSSEAQARAAMHAPEFDINKIRAEIERRGAGEKVRAYLNLDASVMTMADLEAALGHAGFTVQRALSLLGINPDEMRVGTPKDDPNPLG